MGKVMKVAVPIATFAAGAYFLGPGVAAGGAGSVGAGGGPMFMTGMTATGFSTSAMTAASGGVTSSLFSGLGSSLFSGGWKSNLSWGMRGLSALNTLSAGQQQSQDYKFLAQLEERRQRLARIQALQLESQAIRAGSIRAGSAIAQAAANGQDLSGRSFMAFVADQEDELKTELGNIRVNSQIGDVDSAITQQRYLSNADESRTQSYTTAARTLLSGFV